MRVVSRLTRKKQRLGATVHITPIALHTSPQPTTTTTRASASAPALAPSEGPSFWQDASPLQKGLIVGGSALAAVLLWLAFRPARRRRR